MPEIIYSIILFAKELQFINIYTAFLLESARISIIQFFNTSKNIANIKRLTILCINKDVELKLSYIVGRTGKSYNHLGKLWDSI